MQIPKCRPILFSADMVNAILSGRKTMTRRVVKFKPPEKDELFNQKYIHQSILEVREQNGSWYGLYGYDTLGYVNCPFGKVGNILWVRETWSTHSFLDNKKPSEIRHCNSFHYWAKGTINTGKKRPAIHMPREASRITLEITNLRVERLHQISSSDAIAEGLEYQGYDKQVRAWKCYTSKVNAWYPEGKDIAPILSYQSLWEKINGVDSWGENPWVWVIEFKVIEPPTCQN